MTRIPPGARLAMVVVLTFAIGYAGPTRASTGPTCSTLPAGWSARPLPTFAGEIDNQPLSMQDGYLSWLAPQGSGRIVLATDGAVIERSTDYGCTWRETFNLTEALAGIPSNPAETSSYDPYFVANLAAPAYPGDPNRVYAFLEDNETASSFVAYNLPTLVAESRDGGATWAVNGTNPDQLVSQNVPRCTGTFYWTNSIFVAPSDPNTVYLDCDSDPIQRNAGGSMFRSTDGGVTWNQSVARSSLSAYGITWPQTVIDPANPNEFWRVSFVASGSSSHNLVVSRSTDAGQHWQDVYVRKGVVWSDLPQAGIAVTKAPGSSVQVLTWSVFGDIAASSDGGKHWTSLGKSVKGGPIIASAYFVPGSTSIDVWRSVNSVGWDGVAQPSCAAQIQLKRYVGPRHVPRTLGGDHNAGKILDFVSQDFAGHELNFQVVGVHPTVAYTQRAWFRSGGSSCKNVSIGPLAALPVGP